MVARGLWLAALAILNVPCAGSAQPAPDSNISYGSREPYIDISKPSEGVKREITLDDMVSLREVHEPRQSPDGRSMAFLVKQAFRSCDCSRTALYIIPTDGHSVARQLLQADHISQIRWSPDGRLISYLSSKGDSVQLWTVEPATQRAEQLFTHTANSGVLDYRWSPDGTRIAFTAQTPADPSVKLVAESQGFLYDDTTMNTRDLMAEDWGVAPKPMQLWLYDLREKRERLVWTTGGRGKMHVGQLEWSPSGRKLAFFYSDGRAGTYDAMGIIDTATLAVSLLGDAGGSVSGEGAWSADENSMAFLARSVLFATRTLFVVNIIDRSRKAVVSDLVSGNGSWLAWDTDRHRFLLLLDGIGMDRRQTGLYSLDEGGSRPTRLSDLGGKLGDCDIVLRERIACVGQAPSSAPRPVLASIIDGSIQSFTNVNPELASIELSPVRELRWQNSYGDETNGYLILPIHRTSGARVPLVVMGYGFSGEFVAQASQSLTTYPAQAFARDGIAVLLFNYPQFARWEGANFQRASRAFGFGPLSSLQAIVRKLDSEGLIDPRRVGMMGHSLAGFWVELAISQTNLFKAVELHNGGTDSEPGTYWEFGSKHLREQQEMLMGGPPYGETLKNYLGFSVSLNANRIHAPVLMEYDSSEAFDPFEVYEALQHYQVPVDYFIYPNDGHVTQRPEHRFVSLQRNLDWFEFWLLDRENDAPSKGNQYLRWRQFRMLLAKNHGVERHTE
jgi:dipeptidyl aminopeptidase/acylaminoacyl peptidase